MLSLTKHEDRMKRPASQSDERSQIERRPPR